MRNPLDSMRIRPQQFGSYNPISNTFGMVRNAETQAHQGWDLLAPVGTPVYAIADGELTSGLSTSYGQTLTLRFKYGGATYWAFYAHLSMVVEKNESVPEGTVIGLTGKTGNAVSIPNSEAHLHFEIRTAATVGAQLAGRVDPGRILGYSVYSSPRE